MNVLIEKRIKCRAIAHRRLRPSLVDAKAPAAAPQMTACRREVLTPEQLLDPIERIPGCHRVNR